MILQIKHLNMKQYIYFFIITIFLSCFSFAQNGERKFCGTTKIMEEALQDPEKKTNFGSVRNFYRKFRSKYGK